MQSLEQSEEQYGSPWHRRLTAVRGRLAGLTGWRRPAVLGGLGVMAALALPPVYLLPLLFPAFTGLLWALEDGLSHVGERPFPIVFPVGLLATRVHLMSVPRVLHPAPS